MCGDVNGEHTPAVIVTDAHVAPGLSGGGLFASSSLSSSGNARWLGLVTSNARHSGGQTVTTIGYVLPVAQLAPVINIVAKLAASSMSSNAAAAALQGLDVARPELDTLWGLAAIPSVPSSKL
jgi:peroxisomal leader peptide-processing protease